MLECEALPIIINATLKDLHNRFNWLFTSLVLDWGALGKFSEAVKKKKVHYGSIAGLYRPT